MKEVVTQRNYTPKKGKKNFPKSQTVQNEQINLGKLLERHAQGIPLSVNEGVYGDQETDEDGVDLQKYHQLDPVDREEILEGIKAMTERFRSLEKELREEATKKETPQESK